MSQLFLPITIQIPSIITAVTLNAVDDVPQPTFPSCSACGGTKVVTLPDVIFTNPVWTMPTCAEIEAGGLAGLVAPQFCVLLPAAISTTCGCMEPDIGDTMTMAPTSGPTMGGGDSGAVVTRQFLVAMAASGLVAKAMTLW
jgi:hypothetical protein